MKEVVLRVVRKRFESDCQKVRVDVKVNVVQGRELKGGGMNHDRISCRVQTAVLSLMPS